MCKNMIQNAINIVECNGYLLLIWVMLLLQQHNHNTRIICSWAFSKCVNTMLIELWFMFSTKAPPNRWVSISILTYHKKWIVRTCFINCREKKSQIIQWQSCLFFSLFMCYACIVHAWIYTQLNDFSEKMSVSDWVEGAFNWSRYRNRKKGEKTRSERKWS